MSKPVQYGDRFCVSDVRPATASDSRGIAEAYTSAWESHWAELGGEQRPDLSSSVSSQQARFERMMETGERRFLIVCSSGTVAGFVSFGKSYTRPETSGEVMQLFVHPKHQRRGAGCALLREAERQMFLEWPEVHVWASKGNPANVIYENLDWIRTGREKEIKSTMNPKPIPVVEYRKAKQQRAARWNTRMVIALTAGVVAVGVGLVRTVVGRRKLESTGMGNLHYVHGSMGACLDGSAPAYYYRPGSQANRTKWLLYFQGGGWCSLSEVAWPKGYRASIAEHCVERARTPRGSTANDSATYDFDRKSLFSRDVRLNPTMHDWHVVLLRYCDGTSFASNLTEQVQVGNTSLHFKGFSNARAILEDVIVRYGLGSASDVVVSGCSAGALAAPLNAGQVQQLLPNAFVAVLVDSGLFPDWSVLSSEVLPGEVAWPISEQVQEMFNVASLHRSPAIPPLCLEVHASALWRCLLLEHLLPFAAKRFPTFVLQSRFDHSNIRTLANTTAVQAFGVVMGERLQSALRVAHDSPWPVGLFLDGCMHHCMRWGEISVDGVSPAVLFDRWWQRTRKSWRQQLDGLALTRPPSAETFRAWETSLDFPCERCCADSGQDTDHWRRNFRDTHIDDET